MHKLITLLTLLCAVAAASGAELKKFIARGYVLADSTEWAPLDSVHLSLSPANDTTSIPFKILVGDDSQKMIGSNGEIRIMVYAGRGDYMLTLDREGYQPLLKEFKVTSIGQDVVWLGSMKMKRERMRALNEVEVVATAIKMVMNGDTLVYNADAFNLAEGSMLDALVKQLPGAQLSADGKITVNGRFINSLLVNGKDFFKGDPQVALQNLPAYTVKNVKVYDKAADDDYLTNASAKLARREEEENLVMDIVLKKEYSLGIMTSVEAGYGTADRYVGKVFGMLFSDKFKVAAFHNSNNLNDSSEGNLWTDNGFYSGGSNPFGLKTANISGLTYNFDDGKRWSGDGNASFSHETDLTEGQSASTLFYPGGTDLYGRSAATTRILSRRVSTRHYVHYKGDNIYLLLFPEFSWSRSISNDEARLAQFNRPPVETSRTEALDSVFARPFSQRYDSMLLSRMHTHSLSRPDRTSASLQTSATISPSDMRGRFIINLSGAIDNSRKLTSTVQRQHFGGANISTSAPVSSARFTDLFTRARNAEASIRFSQDWKEMSDEWSNSIGLGIETGYRFDYDGNDDSRFNAPDGADLSALLPSLTRPEDFVINIQNSADSRTAANTGTFRAELNLSRERVAPVDTGFNPRISLSLSVEEKFVHKLLDYRGAVAQRVLRRDNVVSPQIYLNFSTSDKRRNTYGYLRYSVRPSLVGPSLFLTVRNNFDPFNIYLNNADGLKNAVTHHFWLYVGTYDRSQRQLHGNMQISYDHQLNMIGQASTYNEQTGVTTYTPRNIDGNWNLHVRATGNISVGPANAIEIDIFPSYGLTNSVDFITLRTEPERSEVRSTSVNVPVRVGYKFKNGSVVQLAYSPEWQFARSDRPGFSNIDSRTHTARLSANIELPADIRIDTDMNMELRRGFNVSEMNTTQWLWNASASKGILNGKLVFKVAATDILGQIKKYSVNVNAQGRYENWRNTLPRYVLLSVAYRFNHHPKK